MERDKLVEASKVIEVVEEELGDRLRSELLEGREGERVEEEAVGPFVENSDVAGRVDQGFNLGNLPDDVMDRPLLNEHHSLGEG